ncbi:MAG: ImmA/IrrE family metallo-endopeptidase [Ruminococcus flavefaciens]|nr:ImmA/IrrE family metallo-endopeptidase [Ruminococcus flavefaciens]
MFFSNTLLKYFLTHAKEEDITMCNCLRKIMGKTPEEILAMTGQTMNIPVDISAILRELNISEVKMDFMEIEQALTDKDEAEREISGMVLLSGNNLGIFYSTKDSVNRQRFTIAHELAHCCLNGGNLENDYIEFRHYFHSDDEIEVAANTFAGEILIPEQSLKKVYNSLAIPVIGSLAKIFQVSKSVMKERLNLLHMDYFDTDLNKMITFGEL